jgi:hypothetical protein
LPCRRPGRSRQPTTGSRDIAAILGAIVSGIVLLLATGWLFVWLTGVLRPAALEGFRLRDMATPTPGGGTLVTISFGPIVHAMVAFLLVMPLHELVHGAMYWWTTAKRPSFGMKGLFPYATAPSDVYFPRNVYLGVGIAPLLVLTLAALLLVMVVPAVMVPSVILFVAFNTAGGAGDLVMVGRLLSYSPRTMMQDVGTGVVVYGPHRPCHTTSQ